MQTDHEFQCQKKMDLRVSMKIPLEPSHCETLNTIAVSGLRDFAQFHQFELADARSRFHARDSRLLLESLSKIESNRESNRDGNTHRGADVCHPKSKL